MTAIRALWRRVPVDVVALIAIAIAIVATHLPVVAHGMVLSDPSWYFHFGHRVTGGDVPYRDFVFQSGPLPIYVDAGFQSVFGAQYTSSIYAGLFVKSLRVFAVWMIARRLSSMRAAALLAIFCAFDPLFAFVHHTSTAWAALFVTLAGLFCVLASRAHGRRALVHLAMAGLVAALVLSARQGAFALLAALLAPCTVLLWLRGEFFTPARLLALWGGFAGGVAVIAIALAAQGALGAAIVQLFVEAPGTRGIRGLPAILDALSGGGIVDGRYTYVTGFLFFIGLPVAVVAGALVLARREHAIRGSTIALVLVPGALCIGNLMRDASLQCTTDLPRTFLTAIALLAVVAPERARRWLGIEPLVVVGLAALPLATDWALEMSFPGRGWADVWSLITGVILVALASAHLTRGLKIAVAGLLALAAIVHVGVFLRADLNPFAHEGAVDATLAENHHSPQLRGRASPVLHGVQVTESRARALEWLAAQVVPRSTCFVYANLPSLYDLLDCKNPTRVDSPVADFAGAGAAQEAAAALLAAPPDVIIASDRMWLNPPISVDLEGKLERYPAWNAVASMRIHAGLRAIIDRYVSVGTVGEAIGPALAAQAAARGDAIDALRVYRRVR